MDRQADQMLRDAAALADNPTQLSPTAISALPAGSREYSLVSTMTGNDVCSRSVEITSEDNGAAPHVVTNTSGNCSAAAPEFRVPTQGSAPVPNSGPPMIMTKVTRAPFKSGRIDEASLN
jgi:hypothetical protein